MPVCWLCNCVPLVIFALFMLLVNRFNVGEIGAMSKDIPYMAKVLVKRIKADPKVDNKRNWKVIETLIEGFSSTKLSMLLVNHNHDWS